MTPEDLEAIPEIGPAVVEKILIAVNSYYAQFEPPAAPVEETVPEIEASEATAESGVHPSEAEPVLEAASHTGEAAAPGPANPAESSDHHSEFDTIKNSEDVG
jgi:hypothetical protein